MSLHRTSAIVLRNYNLGETDRITVFLSARYGKVSGVSRRARKLTSPFAGRLEPLSEVDLVYFLREGKTLARVNHVDLIHSFQALREDLSRLGPALKMSELMDRFTREGEATPLLYGLLARSLRALEGEVDGIALLVPFVLNLLALTGYEPQLGQCVHCSKTLPGDAPSFSPLLGGILCSGCAPLAPDRLEISPPVLAALRCGLRAEPGSPVGLPGPSAAVQSCLEVLERYIQTRMGRAISLRPFFDLPRFA